MVFDRLTTLRPLYCLLVTLAALLLSACGSGSAGSSAVPGEPVGAVDVASEPDGSGDALPEFASLNWVAPSEREDGTPLALSEIAGYRIHYGVLQGEYPNRIDIEDGSAVQASLNDVAPGRYYFVITTIDMDGRESAFSDEVSLVL